jgi:hypothetical protein
MPQSARPPYIRHYEEIQNDDTAFLRGSNERRSIGSAFSR